MTSQRSLQLMTIASLKRWWAAPLYNSAMQHCPSFHHSNSIVIIVGVNSQNYAYKRSFKRFSLAAKDTRKYNAGGAKCTDLPNRVHSPAKCVYKYARVCAPLMQLVTRADIDQRMCVCARVCGCECTLRSCCQSKWFMSLPTVYHRRNLSLLLHRKFHPNISI